MERKHRHILNMARALRSQGNLPKMFWRECVLTTIYLINRTPSNLLKGKARYELLLGKLPLYSHIRSFSCLASVHDHDLPKDKLHAQSHVRVFIGYPFGKKGRQFYGLETQENNLVPDCYFL